MFFLFIKTTKAKGYEYINLVESYWEDGTTKHRVLYNFGRRDLLLNDKSFINVVKKLCEIAEIPIYEQRQKALYDCSEAVMLNYGYVAYAKLWEMLGIGGCMREIQDKIKIEFALSEACFLMSCQHLMEPRSKLGTYRHRDVYYGMNEVELQYLYRALDKLDDNKELIESRLFEENYKIVDQKIDVVFYDVTTFAFQSVETDELRNFGFSKDCKFNEVQVVMGLLIDANGFPIGYELFSGNTFDGKTMVKSLENLKKRFGINRVIIVADRGLNSKSNLNLIREAGYGYIVASSVKKMKSNNQAEILNNEGYTSVNNEDSFRYKTIDYINEFSDSDGRKYNLNESLIVSYSEKRANKDRADRQRLIDKANKLLNNPETINAQNKRGGKKYLKNIGKESASWEFDEKKADKDALFDGYYAIQTSEKTMNAEEVIAAYHTLWKIEDSFRLMKSTLEVRPVFHWTPKRIRGHFVVCFLSFMMERKLELLLSDVKKAEESVSPEKIREALKSMQLAQVVLDGDEVFIKTKNDQLANTIFKILKLKIPKNLNKKDELDKFFSIKKNKSWGQLSLF